MRQPRSQVLAILSLFANFAKVRVAHRAVRKGQAHLRVFFAVAHGRVWRSAFGGMQLRSPIVLVVLNSSMNCMRSFPPTRSALPTHLDANRPKRQNSLILFSE